jgi:glycosyltransferase involved in cell wall biosynthesis
VALTKILIVSFDPIPVPDGRSVRVESLLRALHGRYDVDVLCPKVGDLPHIDILYSARVLRVPLGRGHLHAEVETFARAVRRQLESDEYRVVHLCDPRLGGPVCELARPVGYRFIFEPLGSPLLDLGRRFPRIERNEGLAEMLRAAERMCLGAADRVVVATESARRYMTAQGANESKVAVLSGAVDLGIFRPSHVSPVARPRVAYVGELAPWQGVGTLLRAAKEVVRTRPEVRFALSGPATDSDRQALAALVRSLGIEASVELGHSVSHRDVPRELAADVCVIPTEDCERSRAFGPFPTKLAEAMAVARPVVASDLPVHRELAREGEEGLYFTCGDHAALSESILRLLGSLDQREDIGHRGHGRIRSTVSHTVFREKLLALYSQLVGDTSSAPRPVPVREQPATDG